MRLIDADKFLDLLKNSSEGFWRKNQMVNGEPLSEAMSYEMNTIRKCIADTDAKAEYAAKWVRVEEGLPEEKYAVVVYCPEYNNTYIASLHWDSDEDGEWYCWYYYTQGASRKITEDVIAWMPIPKYEGVSE